MATVSNLYYDIGLRIGDPSNTKVESWQLLRWINSSIKDIVKKTDCLWNVEEVSGQQRIKVIDYSNLSDVVISLKTSNDSSATDYTEGAGEDWLVGATNAATATAIAAILDAHADVFAYADSSYVYVGCLKGYTISTLTCDADEDYLTISDDGYVTFEMDNVLSSFRKVRNIYDTGEQLIYRPYDRQDYDRVLVDSNYAGYGYYVDSSYKMWLLSEGSGLTSDGTFKLDYLYWNADLTAGSNSPEGILTHYDEVIIQRVMYYYFMSQGLYKEMHMANIIYRQLIRELQCEIRSQGEPLEIEHFYRWH